MEIVGDTVDEQKGIIMGLDIGKHTYGSISLRGNGIVTVGKFCSIANGVKALFFDDHRVDWITTFPFLQRWKMLGVPDQATRPEKIVVGNDVWLGTDVILLGGDNIGDGAVIGAFSVVSGKIPPYTVAVGNPAKPVKERFTDEQIQSLLQIKWWDWPDEKIIEYAALLSSDKINEFLKRAQE